MHILLLNLYYPPDTSATAKMAETVVKALAEKHQVTVLAGRPSYDPAERRPWRLYQVESMETGKTENSGRGGIENAQQIRVVRVGSTDFPRMQMKLRVLNYLTYAALVIPRALFTECDAVLAMTDPPFEGIIGAFLATLKRKPYFYNVRDMYPDMALGGSIVAPGAMARTWEKLHRWALHHATCVIVLGGDMRDRLLGKGVRPDRIAIVRDGADLPSAGSAPAPLDAEVIRNIRGNFRFVLLHAGNLGFYGAWPSVIAAAKQLNDDGIGFIFVGEGAQRREVEALAAGLPNVRFLPFFPSAKLSSVLAAADAHLITVKRGLEGVVVPSKMYGILAAGKPIVAVAPAETDAVTLGKKLGFSVAADPDRPDEVAATIRQLAADLGKLERMAKAARAAAPAYDRSRELRKLIDLVETSAQPAG